MTMKRLLLLLLLTLILARQSACAWALLPPQTQQFMVTSPSACLSSSWLVVPFCPSSATVRFSLSRLSSRVGALSTSSAYLETNEAQQRDNLVGVEQQYYDDDIDHHHDESNDDDSFLNNPSSTDATYMANLEIGRLATVSYRNATAANVAYHILRQLDYPDTVSYNGVLKALAKASFFVPRAANMCSELLEEMEDLFQQQLSSNHDWYARNEQGRLSPEELEEGPPRIRIKPNIRSYSTVMDAWCRKRDGRQSAQKAQDLLEKLERLYQEQKESLPQSQYGTLFLQPNVISYNTAIAAWAKSGVPGAPDKCRQLLQNMIQRGVWPDVISYNALLHAYARSALPNAGELAEDILRNNMTRFQRTSITSNPSKTNYNGKVQSSRSQQPQQKSPSSSKEQQQQQQQQQQPLVQPNARTYTTVMDAWSRSVVTTLDPKRSNSNSNNNVSCAQRAHALLREMEDLYRQTKDESIRPNCVSYSTVIHGYALSSQRDEPYKAYKAWQLLQEMIAISSSTNATLASSRAFNPLAQPSLVTYNNVLNACASSTPPTPSSKASSSSSAAAASTQRLSSEGVSSTPEPRSIATPHTSAQNSKLERLASELSLPKMVQTIYQQLLLDPDLQPDHFTYGTLLKAISNLRSFFDPEDGNPADFIRQVFHDCCQRGRVSSGVLFQLRQAAPLDLFRELVLDVVATPRLQRITFKPPTSPSSSSSSSANRNKLQRSQNDYYVQAKTLSIEQLPAGWTRNVRERRRRATRPFRGSSSRGSNNTAD